MESQQNQGGRPSVLYDLAVGIGLLIFVTGVVLAAFGVGGNSSSTTITVKDFSLTTSALGMVIAAVAAFFTATLLIKKPSEIHLWTGEPTQSRLARAVVPVLIVAGAICGILALVFWRTSS